MANTSSTIEMLLKRNLLEVFGEHDPAKRRAAINELYVEDPVFSDPHQRRVGREALDGAVVALHELMPGYAFKQIGAAQTLADSGRLAWSFGPAEDPRRITGLDVIVVRGDRIAALYTFLDEPAV
jgi:SnoaL-like protein